MRTRLGQRFQSHSQQQKGTGPSTTGIEPLSNSDGPNPLFLFSKNMLIDQHLLAVLLLLYLSNLRRRFVYILSHSGMRGAKVGVRPPRRSLPCIMVLYYVVLQDWYIGRCAIIYQWYQVQACVLSAILRVIRTWTNPHELDAAHKPYLAINRYTYSSICYTLYWSNRLSVQSPFSPYGCTSATALVEVSTGNHAKTPYPHIGRKKPCVSPLVIELGYTRSYYTRSLLLTTLIRPRADPGPQPSNGQTHSGKIGYQIGQITSRQLGPPKHKTTIAKYY